MSESKKPDRTPDETPDDDRARSDADVGNDVDNAGNSPDVDSDQSQDRGGDSGDEMNRSRRPVRSGGLVWLALLLALGSLGLASYPYWSDRLGNRIAEPTGPSAAEFERLAARVDSIRRDSVSGIEAVQDDVAGLSAELEASSGPDAGVLAQVKTIQDELDRLSADIEASSAGPDGSVLADRIDQLSARVELMQGEQNTALGGMRSRLDALESEVGRRLEQFESALSSVGSDLDRADRDLATRLLLTEVDSLFAIAQNHLVVGGDGGVALQSWERAVERLTALEGGEFQTLKDTARRELEQLREYRPPELGMQIERLFEMADAVGEWPVKTVQPGRQPNDSDPADGWRDRLGQVVGSLVRVESVDREFLGPDEIDRAREQVRSLLQTAALALVRSRPELARSLVGQAAEAAQRVFDSEASEVGQALAWLEDTAASVARVEPPDLTRSRAEISTLLGGLR